MLCTSQDVCQADKEVGEALAAEPRLLPALEMRAALRLRRRAHAEAERVRVESSANALASMTCTPPRVGGCLRFTQDLVRLIELSPGTARACVQLGVLRMTHKRDFAGAGVAFTRALQASSDTHKYRTLLLRAQAFACSGHLQHAEKDCRKCVRTCSCFNAAAACNC